MADIMCVEETVGLQQEQERMELSTQRVLESRGRLRLIETTNPTLGVGYAVKDGSLGLWSGDSLAEARAKFAQAARDFRAQ